MKAAGVFRRRRRACTDIPMLSSLSGRDEISWGVEMYNFVFALFLIGTGQNTLQFVLELLVHGGGANTSRHTIQAQAQS